MATEETSMTAAEYSEAVYQWLQQAYQWQALAVGRQFIQILYWGNSWLKGVFISLGNFKQIIIIILKQDFQHIWHIKVPYSSSQQIL